MCTRPSFPKPVLEGLASLRETVGPEKSVVASWWDYGYVSLFLNDLQHYMTAAAKPDLQHVL